jgi:hypothetical protein
MASMLQRYGSSSSKNEACEEVRGFQSQEDIMYLLKKMRMWIE